MSNASNHDPQPAHGHETAPEQKPISRRLAVAGVVLLFVVAAVLAGVGKLRRDHADTVLADRTTAMAPPTVNVATPKAGAPVDSFVLPGNVTAFTDSPIYARTDGYITRW